MVKEISMTNLTGLLSVEPKLFSSQFGTGTSPCKLRIWPPSSNCTKQTSCNDMPLFLSVDMQLFLSLGINYLIIHHIPSKITTVKLEITVQRQFMKKTKKIPRSLWSYSDQNPMNAAFFDVDPQKNSANTTVSQYQVKKKKKQKQYLIGHCKEKGQRKTLWYHYRRGTTLYKVKQKLFTIFQLEIL